MLVLDDFRKIYNSQVILSIPNLKFEPGIHWIKGANGAGKSTLFKSIAGIIPFEGDITLNDLRLKKDHVSYRKVVNYSEAEPLYPGFLTAKDLTRFVGTAKGSSPEQQDYYVQRFGISSYFEKACDTYSSGMLKKLSLAMAFL
jgi:ABC-2 type transport system ATP-binding protein